jgi:uncharacterized membrane protein
MSAVTSFDPTLDRAPPAARVLRALALLGLSGASVALAVQFVSMGSSLQKFISTNDLAKRDRSLLLVTMAVGAFLPQIVVGCVWAFRRTQALDAIERWSRLLSPAIVTVALPLLLRAAPWRADPLTYLAFLSVVVVLLSVTVATSLTALAEAPEAAWLGLLLRPLRFLTRVVERRAVALTVVAASGLAYTAYTARLTILDMRRLLMGSYDMGFYDNQMFNSLHGHLFRNTIMYGPAGGNSLASHAEFAHILFLPLYALAPGPETMLLLQAALLGLAAVPLFLFAETQISRPMAVVCAVLYLFYAPLHGAQFYDFHWLTVTVPFVFALVYFLAAGKRWPIVPCVVVLFALREDVAPGVAVIGAFLMATRFRPRVGAGLFLSGVAWFALDKFVIMPAAGTWWFADIYKGLVAPGESGYGSIVRTIVTNPSFLFTTLLTKRKVLYALHLFAPLAFLPLRRPLLLPAVAPGFFFTLMTTEYDAATSITFQYTVHWIPYLFAGSVLALHAIRADEGRPAAVGALSSATIGVLCHGLVFGALFEPSAFNVGRSKAATSMTPVEAVEYRNVRGLIDQIPAEASVIATEYEIPLITTRLNAYSAALYDADAEYVLVHPDHFLLEGKAHLRNLFSRQAFGLVDQRGKTYLFKRGASSPRTDAALQEIGIAPSAPPN